MLNPKDYLDTLSKKAVGFSANEIVEEYVADEEGKMTLSKRKVTTKYYPPDTTALKSALEINELEDLSDAELEKEKQRLLKEFADTAKKSDKNGKIKKSKKR